MSFKDEHRTSSQEPRQNSTERELRGEDDLPIWGQENSREEFVEGHYGTNTAPASATTMGRGRAVPERSGAPSSHVGEEVMPTAPTAAQTSRGETAEHERRFADPEPLTPSSADAPSGSSARGRRTDVVTFSDAANARDRITVGDDERTT